MITFLMLAIFGTVLVGAVLYLTIFKDKKSKAGQPGPAAQSTEQPSKGRATGLD